MASSARLIYRRGAIPPTIGFTKQHVDDAVVSELLYAEGPAHTKSDGTEVVTMKLGTRSVDMTAEQVLEYLRDGTHFSGERELTDAEKQSLGFR